MRQQTCSAWKLLTCLIVVLYVPTVSAARPQLLSVLSKPDYSLYHRKEQILQQVVNIATEHQDVVKLQTLKKGDDSYSVELQVLTVAVHGLDEDLSAKARVLLLTVASFKALYLLQRHSYWLQDFGEHGREFISSELGMLFIKTLMSPTAIESVVGGGERGRRLLALLKNMVFKILPMENPKGRDLVEAGHLCERKNGRGVDPNRNWEVDWGKKEKDYDPNEEYPGTQPFSEPEVQILLEIVKQFKPHVWLNIHSGMEAMFTPWDHKAEVPPSATAALDILRQIHQQLFNSSCVVGSGGKEVGYLAHGTATDYMFDRLQVPMSYTWEIYGDFGADYHDCFKMFNPTTVAGVQEVLSKWLKALFLLLELLPTHPATNFLAFQDGQQQEEDPQLQKQLPSEVHQHHHQQSTGAEGQPHQEPLVDHQHGTQGTEPATSNSQELLGQQHSIHGTGHAASDGNYAVMHHSAASVTLRNMGIGILTFAVVATILVRYLRQTAPSSGRSTRTS